MTNATKTIQEGDMVRCLAGDIDKQRGAGTTGRVTGFARLSSYHAREAFVSFADSPQDSGWFWVRDLEVAAS